MNEVKLVVTGQYRPSGAVEKVKKDIADLTKYAAQLEKAAKGMNSELDDGVKKVASSADKAKEAVAKLGKQTDEAFDKLKAKMEESFKAADEERVVKIKAEYDKSRLGGGLGDIGGFDIDITKGLGPKLAAAFGKVSDSLGKGVDLAQAGMKSAGSFASGLGDGLKAQHPAVQAAVYGTLAAAVAVAAPLAGGVLAGGVVAGFGAGIAGLGVMLSRESMRVSESWSTMSQNMDEDLTKMTSEIEGVMVRTAGRAQTAWARVRESVHKSFDNIAPGTEKLFDGLIKSGQELTRTFEPMSKAANKLFADLGERLPGIIGGLSDSFITLANSVEENPQALGDFLEMVGNIGEVAVDAISWLNDMYDIHVRFLAQLKKPFEWIGLSDGAEFTNKLATNMTRIAELKPKSMLTLEEQFKALGGAAAGSADRIDLVRAAIDRLNGLTPQYTDGLSIAAAAASALDGAFKSAEQQADGFGKKLLDSKGAFDVTIENGRALYENVQNVQRGFGDMAAAVAGGQMSREQFINDAGRMRDRLNDTWRQAGLTQAQIDRLNQAYGLTPDQLATQVRLIGASQAEAQLAWLARDRMSYIYTQIQQIGGYVGQVNGQTIYHDRAHGGIVSAFAHGGLPGGRSNVTVNDWGTSQGEAIRLPQGSTVMTASWTRAQESQWGTDRGAGQAPGNTIVVTAGQLSGLEQMFFEWLKAGVRRRGGDPGVLG